MPSPAGKGLAIGCFDAYNVGPMNDSSSVKSGQANETSPSSPPDIEPATEEAVGVAPWIWVPAVVIAVLLSVLAYR